MFEKVSMTGTGLAIGLIQIALRAAGVQFEQDSLVAAVDGLVAAVGFVFLVWGQIRRTDLKYGIVRK